MIFIQMTHIFFFSKAKPSMDNNTKIHKDTDWLLQSKVLFYLIGLSNLTAYRFLSLREYFNKTEQTLIHITLIPRKKQVMRRTRNSLTYIHRDKLIMDMKLVLGLDIIMLGRPFESGICLVISRHARLSIGVFVDRSRECTLIEDLIKNIYNP